MDVDVALFHHHNAFANAPSPPPTQVHQGIVVLRIIRARHLVNMDGHFIDGVSDPYVKVRTHTNKSARTKTIDNDLNPEVRAGPSAWGRARAIIRTHDAAAPPRPALDPSTPSTDALPNALSQWNETLILNIDDMRIPLCLEVMDEDALKADDSLGDAPISLEGLEPGVPTPMTLTLTNVPKHGEGTVEIEVTWDKLDA